MLPTEYADSDVDQLAVSLLGLSRFLLPSEQVGQLAIGHERVGVLRAFDTIDPIAALLQKRVGVLPFLLFGQNINQLVKVAQRDGVALAEHRHLFRKQGPADLFRFGELLLFHKNVNQNPGRAAGRFRGRLNGKNLPRQGLGF